ncbi:MAG: hypothetical protein GY943_18310 [Chloroflexi bacterium]|nr:hypothetical protein [Chloroflexota bacterium]
MVHALQQIHSLLAPGGRLIDMHPTGEPPPITVRIGDEHHLVGWMREAIDYDPYALADEALKTAVSNHLYRQQIQDTFAYTIFFDTLSDLRKYLADEWSDAYIEDLVAMQIESLMHSTIPDQEIIVKEVVKIAQFHPLKNQQKR